MTNVDVDHVDFYPGGRDEIEAAFAAFVTSCDHVVACGDDPGVRSVLDRRRRRRRCATASAADLDLVVTVDELGPDGARGRIRDRTGDEAALRLRVDGPHNLLNAAAAVGVAGLVGVPLAEAADAVGAYTGVHRRFEHRGSARGADFFDDYGHTPAEMAVTIETARRRRPGRLIALVQPHRYSRVQALWRELGASVDRRRPRARDRRVRRGAGADPRRDREARRRRRRARLARRPRSCTCPTEPTSSTTSTARSARATSSMTMGCGDVWMLGDAALERIGGAR